MGKDGQKVGKLIQTFPYPIASGDQTTDLYPVKVAYSHGSNKVIMEYPLHIKDLEGMKFVPLGLNTTVVDRVRQQFVNNFTNPLFNFLFNKSTL
ncbi:hypothetical protein [Cytobacillus oceanisediminis]|uniref:hypothetical protein n=1 Tax=Cytobacillus oceanisediminis TaxID=665099 RepID=UPI001C226B49|nr:hypothetical protein [Cytobacillus oceanisediminis]MBU8768722.1 hypothetical protein [Cytobacillus oceanisediminis]